MRSDMKKVVVERPRWGSRRPNKKFGMKLRYVEGEDYEDQPKRASISESYHYKWPEKAFTDVLGPLKKFLRSRVGRAWDDVYSELCKNLDKRKVTGKHIFDHVERMVAQDCYVGDDGELYGFGGYSRRDSFYVDPRSGLLCLAPYKSRRAVRREGWLKTPITRIALSKDTAYQWHRGAWYWVRQEYVWNHPSRPVWDPLLKEHVTQQGWHYLAVEKKQCNRDELVKVRTLLHRAEAKRKL